MHRAVSHWVSRNVVPLIGQLVIIVAAFAVMRTELTAQAESIRDLRATDVQISQANLKTAKTLAAVTATLEALAGQVDRQRDDIVDLRHLYLGKKGGG